MNKVIILFLIISINTLASPLHPNKHETEIGKTIIKLTRQVPGTKAWKHSLNEINNKTKANLLFIPYQNIFSSLALIHSGNTTSCAKLDSPFEDLVVDKLIRQAQILCRKKGIMLPFKRKVRKRTPAAFLARRRKFYFRVKQKNFKKAFQNFKYARKFYLSNIDSFAPQKAWAFFLTMGKTLSENKQWEEAREVLSFNEQINNSHLPSLQETYFQIVWTYVNQNKFQESIDFLASKKTLTDHSKMNSKLRFWISELYLRMNNKKEALGYLKKQIELEPLSFYTVLAKEKIKTMSKEKIKVASRSTASIPRMQSLKLSSFQKNTIKRLNLWLSLKHVGFAQSQADLLMTFRPKHISSETIALTLVDLFADHEAHLLNFKVIYSNLNKLFDLDEHLVENLFPLEHLDLVKRIDKEIDPLVVLSLIRQESAFNKFARSGAGARGLMQIMPKTAQRLQKKIKTHQLYLPETNIRLGIKYLKRLNKYYNGNLIYTLASYNAGEGNVKKWIRKGLFKGKTNLEAIESIPFKETRKYVKLIFRNLYFYRSQKNKKPIRLASLTDFQNHQFIH